MMDGTDGKIINKKISGLLGSYDNEFLNKKSLGLKCSSYLEGKSDKIRLDMNTIFAMNFNPEVEKYVNSKTGVKFESYINKYGIYIIEENSKEDKYKLLKFDL